VVNSRSANIDAGSRYAPDCCTFTSGRVRKHLSRIGELLTDIAERAEKVFIPTHRVTSTQTLALPANPALPAPPDDRERDSYLRSSHRWVPVASAFGGFLTTVSLLFLVRSQAWAIPLLIPLAIATVGMIASLLTSVQKRRDTLARHCRRVASFDPVDPPSVDVFLPSAGEDLAVLANTYYHVSRLEWAGEITVYVLDDSAREAVRDLAWEHGFRYLTRPNRGYLKKAGNLRYGYQNSSGDFIAIFDADFVPRPDYFHHLMPYTTDKDVAIVQSPQFFDTRPRMNWVQFAAGATQILFYRWVQPARDHSAAAICVGTCAIYRRSALNRSGGFAQIGHSEDVHTGVNLMRVGFRVRYVPIVVSKGLCPDTLGQFANQQYRWCTGSMSLLFSRAFHKAPLTAMQRLCFWSGFLYYIDTAINVFVVSLPPILMAVLAPEAVSVNNYLFVFLALIVRMSLVPIITMGSESMTGLTRIQSTYSFAHALALFDAIRGRTDAWQATGVKGGTPTARRVRRLVITWCLLVQALMWGTCLWRAPVYGWFDFLPMMAFAALNLAIAYPMILWRTDLPNWIDPMMPRRHLAGLHA
jgi:cellulose synthase/poly-beta-1,6-N-acetylglucosamine synthase-like glycosyltransferase